MMFNAHPERIAQDVNRAFARTGSIPLAGQHSRDLLILWVVLLPGLLLAGGTYAAGLAGVAVGISISVFAVSTFMAPEIGLYLYFAFSALDPVFVNPGSTLLTPGKAMALVILLVYGLRAGWRVAPMLASKPFVVSMLLFALMGFVSVPVASVWNIALRNSLQIVVHVLLIIVAIHTLKTRATIGRALLFTVLGGVVGALYLLAVRGQSGAFGRATLSDFVNPNTTALALSVPLAALPAAYAYGRNLGARFFCLGGAPVLLAAVMKTGSRSALAAVFLPLVLGALVARGTGVLKRLLIPALCLTILGTTIGFVLQSDVLGRKSQERLTAFIHGGGSTSHGSRFEIWPLIWSEYVRQPWGFGYGNTAYAVSQRRGWRVDVHSTYLGVLVEAGPITFVLFAYGLWQLLRTVLRIRETRSGVPATMLLGFIAISCVAHTVHFTRWFWVPVAFCLLLAEQTERERREDHIVLGKASEVPTARSAAATSSKFSQGPVQ